jgi:hypothetical protein
MPLYKSLIFLFLFLVSRSLILVFKYSLFLFLNILLVSRLKFCRLSPLIWMQKYNKEYRTLYENKIQHYISDMKADIKLCASSFSVVTLPAFPVGQGHDKFLSQFHSFHTLKTCLPKVRPQLRFQFVLGIFKEFLHHNVEYTPLYLRRKPPISLIFHYCDNISNLKTKYPSLCNIQ